MCPFACRKLNGTQAETCFRHVLSCNRRQSQTNRTKSVQCHSPAPHPLLSLNVAICVQKIEWYPGREPKKDCYMKGGSDEVCQNYIRILTQKKAGHFIICGTNAYDPKCKEFKLEVSHSKLKTIWKIIEVRHSKMKTILKIILKIIEVRHSKRLL